MMPGKEVEETTGTESSGMGFGGFWLISDHTGQMEGKPFKGHSMMGFDPQPESMSASALETTLRS
jgi:hypothetical protein